MPGRDLLLAGACCLLTAMRLLAAGCGYLEVPPGAAATSVRGAATPVPARALLSPATVPTPTRAPLATPQTPEPQADTDLEQSVADIRVALEQTLRSAALPGLEDLRLVQFDRHHHQALIIATTQGWAAVPPLTSEQLMLTLHRYAASGEQDSEHGEWLIDVFEEE